MNYGGVYSFIDNNRKYLAINVGKEEEVVGHEWEMMAFAKPYFLLDVSLVKEKEQDKYIYSVYNKNRMLDLKNQYQLEDIKKIVKGFAKILEHISLYFLVEDHFILEPDLVYLDEEGQPHLMYLPINRGVIDLQDKLVTLFEKIEPLVGAEDIKSLGLLRSLIRGIQSEEMNKQQIVKFLKNCIYLSETMQVENTQLNDRIGHIMPRVVEQSVAIENEKPKRVTLKKTTEIVKEKEIITSPIDKKSSSISFLLKKVNQLIKKNSEDEEESSELSNNLSIRSPKGELIPITKSPFLIGKEEVCDVVIKNNAISRKHCKLLNLKEGLFIVDTDSTNGTYLGDMKCESNQLYDLKDIHYFSVGHLTFEVVRNAV